MARRQFYPLFVSEALIGEFARTVERHCVKTLSMENFGKTVSAAMRFIQGEDLDRDDVQSFLLSYETRGDVEIGLTLDADVRGIMKEQRQRMTAMVNKPVHVVDTVAYAMALYGASIE